MKNYDVVIVGAGLAGLQCAKLLAQRSARVLLFDRKADLTKGVHTTGIFVRKTLEDFDFPAQTLGRAVKNVTLYSPTLKTLDLRSQKEEFRVGKMGKLYDLFLRECQDIGVEFLNEARFVSSTANEDGETIVRLEKGGKSLRVKTKVLIGADGVCSCVAKDLRLDENKEWIVGCEEVYRAENRAAVEPRLHCFLDAKLAPGYLAWVADDGEETHVGVGGYAGKFNPRKALEAFKTKIDGKILNFRDLEFAETRGGRIPVGGVLRKIANENGLLIGDAAGAVSPLTAGGLDACLRLSKLAAEIVSERLRTEDPKVLLEFSGELFRARFFSRLWMRRLIANISNQTLFELGFFFLRGKFGTRFAQHIFFGRGSFPDFQIRELKIKKSLKIPS